MTRGPADAVAAVLTRVQGRRRSRRHSMEVADRLRRRLDLTNPERVVYAQEEAQRHIADGTLVMGRQTYAAPLVHKFKGDKNRVVIGSFSSIAPDSHFYVGGMHPLHWVTTFGLREMFDLPGAYEGEMPGSRGDIRVGNDCWVTDRSTVFSGITIGDGAVVGTEAVVTKDVRPYTIVAGNPAREIGRRFAEEQAAALQRIAWWDWPLELILERVEWLNGRSVDDFIERFDPGP